MLCKTLGQGYTTEIEYDYSYFKELNPSYMNYKLVSVGIIPPNVKNACELGFGQGISLNIHNCMPGIKWYGINFNPTQVGFAQSLTKYSIPPQNFMIKVLPNSVLSVTFPSLILSDFMACGHGYQKKVSIKSYDLLLKSLLPVARFT